MVVHCRLCQNYIPLQDNLDCQPRESTTDNYMHFTVYVASSEHDCRKAYERCIHCRPTMLLHDALDTYIPHIGSVLNGQPLPNLDAQ